MHIEVRPATPEEEPVLANLIELCAHDFSEFHGLELGPDGRFGYKDLPLYWLERNRHAFLVRVDGKLAGFVLVKKGSEISAIENVWDMAEFFVIRGYRRRGIGTGAAHDVWRRFPGSWEVRVMDSNQPARRFWEHAINDFAGDAVRSIRVTGTSGDWRVYSFESVPMRNDSTPGLKA